MNRTITGILLVIVVATGVSAQMESRTGLSVSVEPVFTALSTADTMLDPFGYGAQLNVGYTIPSFRSLGLRAQADYTSITTEDAASHSLVGFEGDVTTGFDLGSRIRVFAYGGGGYFMALSADQETQGRPLIGGGAGLSFALSPAWDLTADLAYRQSLGLAAGVRVGVGATLNFLRRERRESSPGEPRIGPLDGVDFAGLEIQEVYPVNYTLYDTAAVGGGSLVNGAESTIEDLKVTFALNEYMDDPVEVAEASRVEPGESLDFDIYPLFNESVLSVTARKRTPAKLVASYRAGGQVHETQISANVYIQNRNAIRWDDDHRAAAFISPTDPVVTRFARNIRSMTKGQGSNALDDHFLAAISLHDALRLYRVRYSIDPSSSYQELSLDGNAIDYLQYPVQTLDYRSGDCDDLTILYCSMFESLGIETAFITVPGHIFMAFSLKGGIQVARALFDSDEYISLDDGRAWIPVEVTATEMPFLEAWRNGQANWHRYSGEGQAMLIPTREAWERYPPVHLPQEESSIELELPYDYEVLTAYLQEVIDFIDRKIADRAPAIQQAIADAENQADIRRAAVYMNRLGILYARYGKYSEAEAQFERTLDHAGEFAPALTNLGNIKVLSGNLELAESFYERALATDPANPTVLLALVNVQRQLGNNRDANRNFDRLERVDPQLASAHQYLGTAQESSARAQESGTMLSDDLWLAD